MKSCIEVGICLKRTTTEVVLFLACFSCWGIVFSLRVGTIEPSFGFVSLSRLSGARLVFALGRSV